MHLIIINSYKMTKFGTYLSQRLSQNVVLLLGLCNFNRGGGKLLFNCNFCIPNPLTETRLPDLLYNFCLSSPFMGSASYFMT